MVGVRIGMMVVIVVVRVAVIVPFAEGNERGGMAVDKCVSGLVAMVVRVVVAVRIERRPGQAVGFTESLVAAG